MTGLLKQTDVANPKHRDTSIDFAKGVLILLIVMGHNTILCAELGPFKRLVYHFHVLGFLLLPFLLADGRMTLPKFSKRAVSYLYPFVFFVGLSSFAFAIYVWLDGSSAGSLSSLFDLQALSAAIFTPTMANIKATSGFALFWFLPCIFTLCILRHLFSYLPFAWAIATAFGLHLTVFMLPLEIVRTTPWFIPAACFVLILGMSAKLASQTKVFRSWMVLPAFLIPLVALSLNGSKFNLPNQLSPENSIVNLILVDLLAVSALFFIFWLHRMKPSGFRLIESVGKMSLGIYLFHSFIFYGLKIGMASVGIPVRGLLVGLGICTATIVASYLLSVAIYRISFLKAAVFPDLQTVQSGFGLVNVWRSIWATEDPAQDIDEVTAM